MSDSKFSRYNFGVKSHKVLVWSNVFLWESQFSVLVEEAMRLVNQGHEVVMTSCRSALIGCPANPKHRVYRCIACRIQQRRQRAILVEFGIRFERLSLTYLTRLRSFVKRYTVGVFSRASQLELLKVNDGNIHVGAYAISEIRGNPRQTKLRRSELRDAERVLGSAVKIRETVVQIQQREAYTHFVCWNGRRLSDGYVAEVLETRGVPVRSVITGVVSMNSIVRVHGSHVHGKYTERFDDYLKEHLNDEDIEGSAENYVASYRSGVPIPGAPPTNKGIASVPTRARAVVVTSNWAIELSNLNEAYDYEVNETLEAQLNCLNEVASKVSYEIVVRWHPNLAKANKSTCDWLEARVRSLSNLTHIMPEDSVDTYDLVDKSDLIINFGSTVGTYAEAEGYDVIHVTPHSWYSNDVVASLEELSLRLEAFQNRTAFSAEPGVSAERRRRAKWALAFLFEVEENRTFTSLAGEHGPFFILWNGQWTSGSPPWTRLRPSSLKQFLVSRPG